MMGSGAGSLYYMGNGALPRLGVRPDGAGGPVWCTVLPQSFAGGACPRPQFLDLRRSVGASPRPAPSADAGGRTPLIRHGFAVPPSPRRGEGFGGRLWGPPLRGISALCVILEVQGPMGASGPAWRAFLLVLV